MPRKRLSSLRYIRGAAFTVALGGLAMHAPAIAAGANDEAKGVVIFDTPPDPAVLKRLLLQPKTRGLEPAQPDLGGTRGFIVSPSVLPKPSADPKPSDMPATAAAPGTPAAVEAPAVTTAPAGPTEFAAGFLMPFDTKATGLNEEAKRFADAIGDVLVSTPTLSLTLTGHADSSGSDQENDRLSQERADKVRDYIAEHFNIPPYRVVAIGYGSRKPLPGLSPSDPKNRRVQIEAVH